MTTVCKTASVRMNIQRINRFCHFYPHMLPSYIKLPVHSFQYTGKSPGKHTEAIIYMYAPKPALLSLQS